jgi:cytochrome c-type biogenesis protein CcmH
MKFRGTTVWLVAGVVSSTAVIALADNGGMKAADSVEDRALRLETRLVAPCCFRQVLSMHDSDAARSMKEEVRRELEAGRSEEEILRAYVDRYGIQILSEPPAVGFHRILGVAPPVLFAISMGVLLAILRRWRGRTRHESPAAALPAETLRRIERELGSR